MLSTALRSWWLFPLSILFGCAYAIYTIKKEKKKIRLASQRLEDGNNS